MTGEHVLDFYQNQEGTLLLPKQCRVSVACYDSKEVQQAIVLSIYESLHALTLSGMDLRALDGVTVALDARKAACELQSLPDGVVPLEMSDQPETMELARIRIRLEVHRRVRANLRSDMRDDGVVRHGFRAARRRVAGSDERRGIRDASTERLPPVQSQGAVRIR